jgi:predicted esterase
MPRTLAVLLLVSVAAAQVPAGKVVENELPPLKKRGDPLVFATYVPRTLEAKQPAPLVIAVHGGRGSARQFVGFLRPLAESRKAIVIGPQGFEEIVGADGFWWRNSKTELAALDRLLAHALENHSIDPGRITLVGLADGAELGMRWAISKDRGLSGVIALNFLWKLRGTAKAKKELKLCLIASKEAKEKLKSLEDEALKAKKFLERQKYPVVLRLVPGSSRSFFHRWETEFAKAYDWFEGKRDWPAEIAAAEKEE